MEINVKKLTEELIAAGNVGSACNEFGVVWDAENNEIQGRPDVAAIIAAHDPNPETATEQVFVLPIRTPAVYAEDIFVSSRKINDDADEALDEAILESEKAHGEPKSLDLIARSTVKKVSELKQKIVDLEDKIDKLDKRLKKLGN